jgi:hypothetical protein
VSGCTHSPDSHLEQLTTTAPERNCSIEVNDQCSGKELFNASKRRPRQNAFFNESKLQLCVDSFVRFTFTENMKQKFRGTIF